VSSFSPIDDAGYEALYRRLTGQPRIAQQALGTIVSLPPRSATAAAPGAEHASSPPPRTARVKWRVAAAVALALAVASLSLVWYLGGSSSGTAVRGVVLDTSQRAVAGARVTVIGSPAEVITLASGNFVIPTNAADGQQVQLHAEKEGYRPSTLWHPAGNTPAVVVLEEAR
jgi:hypothetical protein